MSDENCTKTSVRQPRELWKRVKNDAINRNMTVDEILTEILSEHYRKGAG